MDMSNINIKKDHFVVDGDYFYYLDEGMQTLFQKVSNGGTAFTYPIIDDIGNNPVVSMEYDGYYFWTLQEGQNDKEIDVRRLYIDNYTVYQKDVYSFKEGQGHKFNVEAFAVESYTTSLSSSLPESSTYVSLTDYVDKLRTGMTLTIGPNAEGHYEDVTITGTVNAGQDWGLNFFVQNNYEEGTPVYFVNHIWLVNKYFSDELNGALYKVDATDRTIKTVIHDEDFESVTASCFYNESPEYNYIILAIGRNARFFNIDTMVIDKTITMDNIKADQYTNIAVTALQVSNGSLFRLQTQASYYGSDYNFNARNYQLTPIRSFVDQVTIDVYPKILPSNGINVAKVEVIAKDQYARPAINKVAITNDDDDTGFITLVEVRTDLRGVGTTYYKAGLSPNHVEIVGLVTQYD